MEDNASAEIYSMERQICNITASVMTYDNTEKKWVQAGNSNGLSRVKIYHHTHNKSYRIVGRHKADQSVVINSAILKGLKYNQATPVFHQWRDSRKLYGLNFQTEEDAQTFANAMMTALDKLAGDDYSTQIKAVEEEMKREKGDWKVERQQMEKRIEELDGEVKNLQEQLEQMKNHSKRLEKESQEMKQKLESKIAGLEAELHQTKHEKTSSQAEVDRLRKELDEAKKQLQVEKGPEKGTILGNSEDTSHISTKETGNISLEDFGKFLYHLSSYLTQDIIRDLTLVLAFSPTESEQAEQDKIKFIRILREKGLISQADITPLTKALVTIGKHGVCDTVKKLLQSNPSEE